MTSANPWDIPAEQIPIDGWNPISIEKAILDTVNQAAQGVSVATRAYKDFLAKQRAYKQAHARAYMQHKGPQTEKKIAVELDEQLQQAEFERDIADVAYRHARDTNSMLRDKLEAFRSVGVSVRQAYENTSRGAW